MQETKTMEGAERDCMSFEGFCTYMKTALQQRIGKEGQVVTKNILKNNNVHLCGLIITQQGSNLSPNIYLDDYYRQYVRGRSLEEIELDVLEVYRKNMPDFKLDISFFTEWENVKQRVVMKLVNYEQNRELLNDVPHYRFLDLAVVFQYLMEAFTAGSGTILIHHSHLKLWDVTAEDLYLTARENTPVLFPYDFRNMCDVMQELMAGEEAEAFMPPVELLPMYVLTNRCKLNGAAAMLYENLLKDLSDRIGRNLYILPSSVHEILLVPAMDVVSREELSEMVREVNETLLPEEVLSDHVYYFSRKTGKLTM